MLQYGSVRCGRGIPAKATTKRYVVNFVACWNLFLLLFSLHFYCHTRGEHALHGDISVGGTPHRKCQRQIEIFVGDGTITRTTKISHRPPFHHPFCLCQHQPRIITTIDAIPPRCCHPQRRNPRPLKCLQLPFPWHRHRQPRPQPRPPRPPTWNPRLRRCRSLGWIVNCTIRQPSNWNVSKVPGPTRPPPPEERATAMVGRTALPVESRQRSTTTQRTMVW